MSILNNRASQAVQAFFNTISRRESDRVTEGLRGQMEVLFAKDPDIAKARIWSAAEALGMSSAEVRMMISEYEID